MLRNASAARQAAPAEMPFAVEARVMAAWRQSRGGVCWMYIIIMLEITTLILLIFYGLS
jgi:hypothetical protein